jgi:hypothetical protein
MAFGDLLGATEAFGGRAPQQFHGLIQQLLTMRGITEEQKLLLEDLLKPAGVDAMKEAAANLGIELKNLGTSFQQADITETALGYARSLLLLDEANALTNEGLRDSAAKLIELGQRAIETGTVLPDTLQPFFQRLHDMGALVDENGEQLIDFGKLQFGEVIDETFQRIEETLLRIEDILKNAVPRAAEDAAERTRRAWDFRIDVPVHVGSPNNPFLDDDSPRPAPPALARGGIITRPTVVLAGEAGPEAIIPLGRGGGNSELVRLLASIDRRLQAQETTLPIAIRDAVKTGGRR